MVYDIRFPCCSIAVAYVVLPQDVEVTGNIVALANRRTLLVYDIKADKVTRISLTTWELTVRIAVRIAAYELLESSSVYVDVAKAALR